MTKPKISWKRLYDILGRGITCRIVGLPQTTLSRYIRGNRKAPELVAARLDYLAELVWNLEGGYNSEGIRNWFYQPITKDLFKRGWDPKAYRFRLIMQQVESGREEERG